MIDHASSDLRLVSVWHGDDADRSLHFSLYNTGPVPVALSTLHMTGGFWLPPAATVRGARREHALSNYTVLAPDDTMALGPDEVWTFSIADLNARPFRSGDGPMSAYAVAADDAIHSVAVRPLARSLDAALTALPHLREPGDAGGYASIQGFDANALNPMLSATHDFVTAAFDTLLARFPGPAVHIGGDEVAPATWSGSPLARATVADGQPTGTLQARLIEPVHAMLQRHRRRTVVWEDAVHNARLDPKDTIALVWQHPDQAHDLAARGFDVVLTPGNAYYRDMAHSDDWNSTGGHWAGTVPLEKTYSFEPGHGWPADRLAHLIGVHACIWGEYMHDHRNFDDLVFPRIYAFAERAWIDAANRDYDSFLARFPAFPTTLRPVGSAD
ncbi:MAG: family 20 glycosylhydrolase [Rubellimicrobium sp.]|nr:family 20 glycosylhydrolase [Rubellimicrobium sp.]